MSYTQDVVDTITRTLAAQDLPSPDYAGPTAARDWVLVEWYDGSPRAQYAGRGLLADLWLLEAQGVLCVTDAQVSVGGLTVTRAAVRAIALVDRERGE